MNGRGFSSLVAGIAVAVGIAIAGGVATGPDPDAIPTGEEVQSRVMSPFCPGLVLAECPSSQAALLRNSIDDKISKGWTNGRIDDWLVSNYGDKTLARPQGVSAWIPPILWASGGGVLTGLVVARWGRRSAEGSGPARSISEEERDRLLEDLERYDEDRNE